MGEVVSVLGGKIRVSTADRFLSEESLMLMESKNSFNVLSLQSPTLLDYGEVLLSLLPLERRTTHLFSYICELSLLYSALSSPPPAKLACAALLLTRALHHYGNNTSTRLAELLSNKCKIYSLGRVCSLCSLLFMPAFSVFAAPLWPSQLVDYTGFSKQDLVSLSVLLYVKW